MGDMTLMTVAGEQRGNVITLKNVLYVPRLGANLLSVKSILSKGHVIVFRDKCAEIYSSGNKLITKAEQSGRMFVVKTCVRKHLHRENSYKINEELGCHDHECMSQDESRKSLWHRRLGHINEKYLDRLKHDEMVRGLQFEKNTLSRCEPCILGKMIEKSHNRIKDEYTKAPLELIHMDLCGPMQVHSLGNSKYVMVMVDSYSRRVFVEILHSKDEAFDCFVRFKNQKEIEIGSKIKTIRTDNGKEFINEKFFTICKNEGIKHQKTVPDNPQSNGVVERMNRNLMDKARTMLIAAELPLEFWAEAVSTAAYLINCAPTKDGGMQTPREKWNGKCPTVAHLKVFGCVAYYKIAQRLRQKLDPKAKKGIFVGYSQQRIAYRIYEPFTGKVIEARTVKFN
jgi:hypothetical protein